MIHSVALHKPVPAIVGSPHCTSQWHPSHLELIVPLKYKTTAITMVTIHVE